MYLKCLEDASYLEEKREKAFRVIKQQKTRLNERSIGENSNRTSFKIKSIVYL